MNRIYTIFNNLELIKKEERLDRAIKKAEEIYQLNSFDINKEIDSEVDHAVKFHSWDLMDIIDNLIIHNDERVPAGKIPTEKYIEILKKYKKALELVKSPYSSIDIEMRIKDHIHKIWKYTPWLSEKLPQEIEEFGLVYDYPSDFLEQYNKVKNQEPNSFFKNQILKLERTWCGSFYIYYDYFNESDHNEFLKRPDFILKDYENICDDKKKFGKVIYSMNGSLKYAFYLNSDFLKSKIEILIRKALTKKPEFVDSIPKELENLVDEQIMSIIKNGNKRLDEVIYEVPDSYRDEDFLVSVDEDLSEDKLVYKEFWGWLFKRCDYKRKFS